MDLVMSLPFTRNVFVNKIVMWKWLLPVCFCLCAPVNGSPSLVCFPPIWVYLFFSYAWKYNLQPSQMSDSEVLMTLIFLKLQWHFEVDVNKHCIVQCAVWSYSPGPPPPAARCSFYRVNKISKEKSAQSRTYFLYTSLANLSPTQITGTPSSESLLNKVFCRRKHGPYTTTSWELRNILSLAMRQ